MRTNERWRAYADDQRWRELFDDGVVDLARRLFGDAPGGRAPPRRSTVLSEQARLA